MTVKELYKFLDSRIPSALSCEWDNDGLMCCTEPNRAVKKVLVALDITDDVIDRAIEGGYDVIVSHHPLIFHPIKNITAGESVPNRLIKLVKSGISAMSFHTRLDSLDGGVNDELAKCLGLNNIKPFGEDGMGRIGEIEDEMTAREFAEYVASSLSACGVSYANGGRSVRKVAVLGGAGSDCIHEAAEAGADAYVSGEFLHHNYIESKENGITIVCAGHYYTENPVCEVVRRILLEADKNIEVDTTESNCAEYI